MVHKCSIIGNGISRKGLEPLERPVFGCNAYYREAVPDFLVAIDPGIVKEILSSSFPKERLITVPFEEQFEPFEWNPNQPRENAGMVAMRQAIKMGYDDLYCYGFDFLIDDEVANLSNIFSGSSNYGPETRTSYHDSLRRVDYFSWFVRTNPSINFHMIYPNCKKNFTFRIEQGKNINIEFVELPFTMTEKEFT